MTAPPLASVPDPQVISNIASSEIQLAQIETASPPSQVDLIKTALEKRRKMFLVTALEGARLASLEDSEFYIEFEAAGRHLRDTLAKIDNVKLLREACREVTGREMGVRFAIRNQVTDDASPLSREEEERQEKQRLREIAERDPMVQQMLSTFRGEIADVQQIGEP